MIIGDTMEHYNTTTKYGENLYKNVDKNFRKDFSLAFGHTFFGIIKPKDKNILKNINENKSSFCFRNSSILLASFTQANSTVASY